ncbi:phenylacetate--CoA ligase family protein [Methanobrevibacter curvatus]|uniref:Phenylacetate-coenzyme A ligase n=1 Tax=Methanobrevibacter curvatus TaxID=49547 RepID=A0A166CA98_9EURY|nr:phenylacetate--CoA ligase [Methanobrevibacter curvatus]KZX14293.1 phenylacetate-coenzyme A ligase [Methanobrevibacter curvatus]
MIYNEKYETMDIDEKKELQLRRLQKIVKTAYEKVPFYKKKFDDAGVKPEDIKTLKDIEKIPFTTKADLREAYPFGMFAVDEEEIVEIHTTSGTTGKPTVTGYTKKDIGIWQEIIARAIVMAGGGKKDIIQNGYGYGLFTGGLGVHHGGYKLGAIVVPMSSGNTKRQLEIMSDFQTTILTCTPSYAMYLAESLEKIGLTKKDISLKTGIFGAEMWTSEMRDKLEEKLGIDALNIYGLTELTGPGVAMECLEKSGLHISDDHFYPEIIDPKTKKSLNEGEKGELVLTTLTKEGMPVIRFRTKDLTSINWNKCKCGRTTPRISRISGRSDDMLKVRGVIVFPSQIESAILKIEGLTPNYQIIITRPEFLDEIDILVEATPALFSDEMKEMEEIEIKIANEIKKEIGLRVNLQIVESESLPRSEGKAVRVIDKRNLEN